MSPLTLKYTAICYGIYLCCYMLPVVMVGKYYLNYRLACYSILCYLLLAVECKFSSTVKIVILYVYTQCSRQGSITLSLGQHATPFCNHYQVIVIYGSMYSQWSRQGSITLSLGQHAIPFCNHYQIIVIYSSIYSQGSRQGSITLSLGQHATPFCNMSEHVCSMYSRCFITLLT